MKRRILTRNCGAALACGLLLMVNATRGAMAEPAPAAVSAFQSYCAAVEARLARQHRSPGGFLAPFGPDEKNAQERMRGGEPIIERVTEPGFQIGLRGALLHHWRGTAFAPGAKAAQFERLLGDFNAYPRLFAPQVLRAGVTERTGDRIEAWMRIRQHHVISVTMDARYDVSFGELDVQHGYSISRSTRIDEIGSPGTSAEHALGPDEEHGFLWRLNTYWSYEERDGGLYLQIEAVSLTRSIPMGLGWAIGPYIESIPRESLEFTLNSALKAIRE